MTLRVHINTISIKFVLIVYFDLAWDQAKTFVNRTSLLYKG